MARYSIVKRHRTYYKYGTEPNTTVVGSPTINEGVVSGFSTSQYLTLPKVFTPSSNTWEQVYKITTGLDVSTQQVFMGNGGAYCKIMGGVQSGKFRLWLSSNNSSWNVADLAGSYTVLSSTEYYIRLKFTGTSYTLEYSLNGNEDSYTTDITVSSSTLITNSNALSFGANQYSSGVNLPFLGSIDLTQSYIKINGQDWWHGTKAVESNKADADYHVDSNKLYTPVRRRRDYYKYSPEPIKIDLSKSDNTSQITDGSFVVNVVYSTTYNNTYTFRAEKDATKVFLNAFSDFVQANCSWTFTVTAITDQGEQELLTQDFGYGVTFNQDFEFDLAGAKKIKGIKIYAKCYARHTNYSFGSIKLTLSCNEGVEATEDDYEWYVDRNVAYDLFYKSSEIVSQTFNVSDELQTYVVPEGVSKVSVVCTASRGTGKAGAGGSVKCDLSVTEGQTLYIMVGGAPTVNNEAVYNASDIRIDGTEYENRIIVAGGGGTGVGANGGAGGGLVGGDAGGVRYQEGAFGGTQEAGGGASYRSGGNTDGWAGGAAGTLGMGGNGGYGAMYGSWVRGGAGGAGYYGGGGGGVYDINKVGVTYAGGGGGSSYTDDTLCENVVHLQGNNGGEGYVKISYIREIYE